MEVIKKIEKELEKLYKGAPHLPESSRKSLADIWPWIALIGGLLQVLSAWWLYGVASRVYDLVNSLAIYTGVQYGPTSMDKTVIYLGVLMLAVEGVLLLMAFPKLKKRQKSGWNLLFLVALINVAYAVVQIFTYSRGIGSFVGSLIGSAIGFYLLFEVKAKFSGGRSANVK